MCFSAPLSPRLIPSRFKRESEGLGLVESWVQLAEQMKEDGPCRKGGIERPAARPATRNHCD